MTAVSQKLIEAVKRKLNITWYDEQTEDSVRSTVSDAIPIMLHKLGITDTAYDFTTPGMERSLFLEFCRYDWNDERKLFDANYWSDIAQVRGVWAMKESDGDS